ncbi:hypothetical protein IMSAGC021_00990 [Muribaculaceae bacterium]|nr:hypothetical protein IMSAGC021_00990 [Muribaculaceae bacterium]
MLKINHLFINVFYPGHSGICRPNHSQPLQFSLLFGLTHLFCQKLCAQHGRHLVFRRHKHCHHMAARRIIHQPPAGNLRLIKTGIILLSGQFDTVMVRMIRLYHHFSGQPSPTGPAGRLGQKLERPFRSMKITDKQ